MRRILKRSSKPGQEISGAGICLEKGFIGCPLSVVVIAVLFLGVAGCGGGGGGSSSNNVVPQFTQTIKPACGDDNVDQGETCDDGNTVTEVCSYNDLTCLGCSADCQSTITAARCGDGNIDSGNGEICDDGNLTNNDGCSSACKIGFSKYYGTESDDEISAVRQMPDGGYIVAGTSAEYGNGIKNYWVIKIDETGILQWQNFYEVESAWSEIRPYSVQATPDGGYVVAGSGNFAETFYFDGFIFKYDSSGNTLWQKYYGDSYIDAIYSIQVTADGGFVAAGSTLYIAPDGEQYYGIENRIDWVLKLDADGDIEWEKKHSSIYGQEIMSIKQTLDGGYIYTGYTDYHGGKINVVKMDSTGAVEWEKFFTSYETYKQDGGTSILQTSDGGYLLAGYWGNYYDSRGIVIKLGSSGETEWEKQLYNTCYENPFIVVQISDGYVVSGRKYISETDKGDAWLLKLDSSGELQWEQTYGGSGSDGALGLDKTSDGGFVIAIETKPYGIDIADYWVLKLDSAGNCNGCFE